MGKEFYSKSSILGIAVILVRIASRKQILVSEEWTTVLLQVDAIGV